MLSHSILMALGLCCASPLAQVGQEDGLTADPQTQDQAGDNQERADAQRRERRARMRRFRDASPEDRRRGRQGMMLRMATRTYELDETQQILVKAEMEAMEAERRAEMGAEADEYDKLQQQMFDVWSKRAAERREQSQERQAREGQGQRGRAAEDGEGRRRDRRGWRGMRDDPEIQKLRKRMREIEAKHPFQWQASVERIEKLLPPEQAEKGRAKWAEQRSRWQERGRNRGRRNRNRGPDSARGDRRADRGSGGLEDRSGAANRRGRDGPGARAGMGARGKADRPVERKIRELHPWEKYVQEFIGRYKLTEAQTTAAMSILKDVMKRAGQIERSNVERIAAAGKIADKAAREARLAELRKPIDHLFKELKKRLDGLPTAGQRSKGLAGQPAVGRRPAG